jgi:hypothetical protein
MHIRANPFAHTRQSSAFSCAHTCQLFDFFQKSSKADYFLEKKKAHGKGKKINNNLMNL